MAEEDEGSLKGDLLNKLIKKLTLAPRCKQVA